MPHIENPDEFLRPYYGTFPMTTPEGTTQSGVSFQSGNLGNPDVKPTGHRLGDMRRLIRQYGRTQDTVFPTGAYYRPFYPTYGSEVNLPVPVTELNNPNFTGCLDRNA